MNEYQTLNHKKACIFFCSTHGIFIKIDYIYEKYLKTQFQIPEITQKELLAFMKIKNNKIEHK